LAASKDDPRKAGSAVVNKAVSKAAKVASAEQVRVDLLRVALVALVRE